MEVAETGHRREEYPDLPVNLLMVVHVLQLELRINGIDTASSN